MEKSVQTLNYLFLGQHLRIVLDEKESPWFIANDVCGILGYENSSKTISDHRKQDGVTNRYPILDGLNRVQYPNFISEGNLYRLILRSKKTEAEQFETWVVDEVLPAIRKKGYYSVKDISKLIEEENQKYEKQLETINTDINKYFISLSNIAEFREYNSLLSQKKGIIDMIAENNKAIKINARHKNKISALDN